MSSKLFLVLLALALVSIASAVGVTYTSDHDVMTQVVALVKTESCVDEGALFLHAYLHCIVYVPKATDSDTFEDTVCGKALLDLNAKLDTTDAIDTAKCFPDDVPTAGGDASCSADLVSSCTETTVCGGPDGTPYECRDSHCSLNSSLKPAEINLTPIVASFDTTDVAILSTTAATISTDLQTACSGVAAASRYTYVNVNSESTTWTFFIETIKETCTPELIKTTIEATITTAKQTEVIQLVEVSNDAVFQASSCWDDLSLEPNLICEAASDTCDLACANGEYCDEDSECSSGKCATVPQVSHHDDTAETTYCVLNSASVASVAIAVTVAFFVALF